MPTGDGSAGTGGGTGSARGSTGGATGVVSRAVVSGPVVSRPGRRVVFRVGGSVVSAGELTAGGGPTTGTATGGGGTASAAGGAAAIDTRGTAPVATPTPRTPATALETPSVERASALDRAPRRGDRRAVVGPATVHASSSSATSA